MSKHVELIRHTDADGDTLSEAGVEAAVELGAGLAGGYEVVVSSGSQRTTQTAACLLAGLGERVPGGVVVDARFRSEVEERWRAAYEHSDGGDIESFRKADASLVDEESKLFAGALAELFERLPGGGRAVVVGHSPMLEAAVWGLSGEAVEPLSKGAGVELTLDDGGEYRVGALRS